MNGFAEHGLDEGAFGEKTGNIVKAFDAFREYCSFLKLCAVWELANIRGVIICSCPQGLYNYG
jgi:hypothetical protein